MRRGEPIGVRNCWKQTHIAFIAQHSALELACCNPLAAYFWQRNLSSQHRANTLRTRL